MSTHWIWDSKFLTRRPVAPSWLSKKCEWNDCFITAPFNNMRNLKFKAQSTNTFFCYRQSNVRRLLPASDYSPGAKHKFPRENWLRCENTITDAHAHVPFSARAEKMGKTSCIYPPRVPNNVRHAKLFSLPQFSHPYTFTYIYTPQFINIYHHLY